MTTFIENNFSVEYKLFGTKAGTDFVAIIFPDDGVLNLDICFDLYINGEKFKTLDAENAQLRHGLRMANYFKQPFYLVVAELSGITGFKPMGIIDRDTPLDFRLLANGYRIGQYQDASLISTKNLAVPDDASIDRVAGRIGDVGYFFTGSSWYSNFKKFAMDSGYPLGKSQKILDWGCGCARLSRYFINEEYTDIYGIDIDPVNINWMRQYFGDHFQLVSAATPTRLPDEYFDVVIGHSVFTHLTENDQFKWLSELWRICSRGARLYVTISAENGLRLTGGQGQGSLAEKMDRLAKIGYCDFGHQDVGVDVLNFGFYRLSMHTHEYIMEQWSKYFDIDFIVQSFAGHQDLVVMSKM